ncbi:unnamed protein product [Lepeophtheirus salmonis]|uniref:(salmon louse) hypothetical protein n=1 Tax=Lepeophtheirus salmonis TaxID=72036 RepID=A0A7R8CF08_LEPSM|nr:unnamed protein product [Lepeophtheirus salmonis]CAF2802033.1 unnamed protein product [Lepeophtheirus salmonis]
MTVNGSFCYQKKKFGIKSIYVKYKCGWDPKLQCVVYSEVQKFETIKTEKAFRNETRVSRGLVYGGHTRCVQTTFERYRVIVACLHAGYTLKDIIECPANGKKCHFCDNRGHFKTECRKMKSNTNVPAKNQRMKVMEVAYILEARGRVRRATPTNRDDRSRLLPQLEMGECLAIQNPISRKWDTTCIIESVREKGRSYIVQGTNGETYLRNISFLKNRTQNLAKK